MPVDNQIIKDKIIALDAKMAINHAERNELRSVIEGLQSILEVEDPLSQTDPKAMKPVMDRGTGADINPARRQSVYDAQIVRADALLV